MNAKDLTSQHLVQDRRFGLTHAELRSTRLWVANTSNVKTLISMFLGMEDGARIFHRGAGLGDDTAEHIDIDVGRIEKFLVCDEALEPIGDLGNNVSIA